MIDRDLTPQPRNKALFESLGIMKEAARGIGFAREGKVKQGLQTPLSAYAQAKKKIDVVRWPSLKTGELSRQMIRMS
jgi:hypothetical protein